jgi:RimJ/RimL family protein N-acetyltransferase
MTEFTDAPDAFGYGDSILVGERVRLRGVRDDDVPRAREVGDGSRTPEGDNLSFAIETLGDPPVLVGRSWLSTAGARPKDRWAMAGIALGREHIGRGYGTDAMRVIVGYGFRELGLHRIQLGVASFNTAGIRAYQKAGFTEEGRYREAVRHDGRWYDTVLMSILDHEWAARRSPSR